MGFALVSIVKVGCDIKCSTNMVFGIAHGEIMAEKAAFWVKEMVSNEIQEIS